MSNELAGVAVASNDNSGSKLEANCIAKEVVKDTSSNGVSNETNRDDSRPILVLVNPRSGRGRSLKIYKKIVSTFLDSHNIKHEVFVTTAEIRVKDYLW